MYPFRSIIKVFKLALQLIDPTRVPKLTLPRLQIPLHRQSLHLPNPVPTLHTSPTQVWGEAPPRLIPSSFEVGGEGDYLGSGWGWNGGGCCGGGFEGYVFVQIVEVIVLFVD